MLAEPQRGEVVHRAGDLHAVGVMHRGRGDRRVAHGLRRGVEQALIRGRVALLLRAELDLPAVAGERRHVDIAVAQAVEIAERRGDVGAARERRDLRGLLAVPEGRVGAGRKNDGLM